MLLLKLGVVKPCVDTSCDCLLALVEDLLGKSTTLGLQTPSVLTIEVKLTSWVAVAVAWAILLDEVAKLDVGEGSTDLPDLVHVVPDLVNVAGAHEVVPRCLANRLFVQGDVSNDHDIHDDVLLFLDEIQALIDSRDSVDIPLCATIHQKMALERLGWEHNRDGA